MARTPGGNLRGKARQTELREQREFLEEDRTRVVQEIQAENDAIRRCVALEGEAPFYKWLNDDEQVQPTATRKERIELIEKRIMALGKHEESVHVNQESV